MELDYLPDPSIYQSIPYSITNEKFKEMNIFGKPTRLDPYYLLENKYELFKPSLTTSASEKNLYNSTNSIASVGKSNASLSNASLSESIDSNSVEDSSLSSIPNNSSAESINKQYKCTVCRKSFSTEATYNNHQKTQKHKALVEKENSKNKKSQKNNKKNQKKRNNENLSISTSQNAAAVEAYKKLKQAEKIIKSHPSIAANVYWNAATVFWNCKLPQETANTLHQLLIILLKHENRLPKKKNSKSNILTNSPPTNQPPELTSSQISQTIYLSCIALARLISENYGSRYKTWKSEEEFNEDEESLALDATTLYLMALKERFGLCIDTVQEFSDLLTTTTVDYNKFKENCNVILRKCNPVAILTKNNESAFYLMLNEVASFHSRIMPDHISLVLYGVASVHAYKEERWEDYVNVNKRICKIFNSLNFYWLSCDCLQEASRGIDLELLCGALMLAIRTDDRVQCKFLEKQIKKILKEKEVLYDDIQYILDLSKCVRNNDHQWLEESGPGYIEINQDQCLINEEKESDDENNDFIIVNISNIEQLYNIVKDRMDII